MKHSIVAAAGLLSLHSVMAQETGDLADLWAIVEQQRAQIARLEQRLVEYESGMASTATSVESTQNAVRSTQEAVARVERVASEPPRTSLGGYGELHYNNLSFADPAQDAFEQIDYHRFVTFIGHRFNERARFFSEIEIEHSLAGDGAPGEVELEQAYVEFDIGDRLSAKTGLFLVPVGILNETHEPPTFYGVERNNVESVILPSTWWEAGGAFSGRVAGDLWWDLALHSGLAMPTTGSNAFRIRSGRQKVAEALASDFAMSGRVRYNGVRGLELAATLQYQADPSQVAGDGLDSGRLLSTHAIYTHNNFSIRGLYARWDFEGAAVEAAGDDVQKGMYVEPSYRFGGDMSRWGIYARYEDVQGARDQDEFTQTEFGFNYWPLDSVTFKFSYMDREHDLDALAGSDFDGFSLGMGYQFY